jgi:DNA-binding transcriptional LysR family regulator
MASLFSMDKRKGASTVEIRHLITFKTITETGGFTKAADQLGYAQSTVTSHIKALEEEFNQPLFDRVGRQIILTEAGRNLLPKVNNLIAAYEEVREAISLNGKAEEKIVISAPEALLIYRFPAVIKTFKERYPNVTIEWRHLDPLTIKQELTTGNANLTFLLGQKVNDPAIQIEKLVDEKMMLLVPNDVYMDQSNFLTDSHLLFTERGCSYRSVFEKLIQEQGISAKATTEFWSIEAIKQSVISGLGVSMLPHITVEKELAEQKLIGIPYEVGFEFGTYMLHHTNKWLSPGIKGFMEVVREYAQAWRGN